MEYKRLECVSVDGSIYSQDAAHESGNNGR